MLALAAARLGLKTHSYGPSRNDPAGQVSHLHTQANYDDVEALARFGAACDAVTYEWESIPVSAVEIAGADRFIAPNLTALRTAQDRLLEKTFLSGLPGVHVAPFEAASSALSDLRRTINAVGLPCVVKTRRGGYDGKGQAVIHRANDIEPVWDRLGAFDLSLKALSHSPAKPAWCARGAGTAMCGPIR